LLFIRRAENDASPERFAASGPRRPEQAFVVAFRPRHTRRIPRHVRIQSRRVGAGTMGGEIAQVLASADVEPSC